MNLDEGQRRKVAEWIEQGAKLSEIQTRIGKEFGISMTYMDVRFLIDDLKLKPKDPEPAPTPVVAAPAAATGSPAPAKAAAGAPAPAPNETVIGGKVAVSVDHVARPGAIVSGRVTFSDGKGGAWLIDQTGRPGLISDEEGYRPSQPDIVEFQTKLQDELAKLGF